MWTQLVDYTIVRSKLCESWRSGRILSFKLFFFILLQKKKKQLSIFRLFQCFHTWYLAVDMQLYLIAPIVVYLIYRFKAKALALLSLLVIGCVGCTIATNVQYGVKHLYALLQFIADWMRAILIFALIYSFAAQKMHTSHYLTHIRFSPWLIGVIAGYLFPETGGRSIRISGVFLHCWHTMCYIHRFCLIQFQLSSFD